MDPEALARINATFEKAFANAKRLGISDDAIAEHRADARAALADEAHAATVIEVAASLDAFNRRQDELDADARDFAAWIAKRSGEEPPTE